MTTPCRYLVLVIALFAGCGSSTETVDAQRSDAFGGANFGAFCSTADDCPGGMCVDTPTGGVCSSGCSGTCPEGWDCRLREQAGELQSICVPKQFDYCTPCTADAQCGGGVCVDLGGTKACLAECPFRGNCPTGYTCGSDPTGSHIGSFCVPQTGTCSCTVAEQGQVRTCTKANTFGTCRGVETCDSDFGGWVNCTAQDAVPETCDAMDNDCDQLIDEGVGGSPCMNTVVNVGSCTGITRCQGVGGVICEGKTPATESCNYLDDDCDTGIDEAFPGLTQVCNVGIGACKRFGVTRCTSNGSGTECSVTPGSSSSELCDTLDNDCDTNTDEAFPTLTDPCTVGVGVCARQGNFVCDGAKTGVVCSVSPGTGSTDVCNGLDDDCDNKTDEGFKNQMTMLYDQPTACGSCTIDCTVLFNVPNATGTCVVSGTPSCSMVCNANSFNLDGQVGTGCELLLDTSGVYVSTDDAMAMDDAGCGLGPVGTGSGNHPCKTITQGIARANTLNRARVLVANGTYAESVTLANGRSLLGGYNRDTWQRNVASTTTTIAGVATVAATNHDYTVRAASITSPTTFDGFVIIGPDNGKTSGNSYAIYVTASDQDLTITHNQIVAGRGGPGANGSSGSSGAGGVAGVGRSSNPAAYDAIEAVGTTSCDASNNRQYTNGGVRSCGGNDVNGGNGGGNTCPPGTDYLQHSAVSGFLGLSGSPALGGAGGNGGEGGRDQNLDNNGNTCYISTAAGWHSYGYNGEAGIDGTHAPAVTGCSAGAGSMVSGHWSGGAGLVGNPAGNGGGGGGGGAGAGAHCVTCPTGKDQLGGHGGGGGSGGCGGGGGGASTAGGGVFGVFIVGGSAPTINNNTIQRGLGASGGRGGNGGQGGGGGVGADGGVNSAALFCPDPGGRGGNGGDGGHGSGGGGACGGSSVGIYTSGVSGSPNYCSGQSNTINGGAAGAGGAGGYSIVNPGGAGAGGAITDCTNI